MSLGLFCAVILFAGAETTAPDLVCKVELPASKFSLGEPFSVVVAISNRDGQAAININPKFLFYKGEDESEGEGAGVAIKTDKLAWTERRALVSKRKKDTFVYRLEPGKTLRFSLWIFPREENSYLSQPGQYTVSVSLSARAFEKAKTGLSASTSFEIADNEGPGQEGSPWLALAKDADFHKALRTDAPVAYSKLLTTEEGKKAVSAAETTYREAQDPKLKLCAALVLGKKSTCEVMGFAKHGRKPRKEVIAFPAYKCAAEVLPRVEKCKDSRIAHAAQFYLAFVKGFSKDFKEAHQVLSKLKAERPLSPLQQMVDNLLAEIERRGWVESKGTEQ